MPFRDLDTIRELFAEQRVDLDAAGVAVSRRVFQRVFVSYIRESRPWRDPHERALEANRKRAARSPREADRVRWREYARGVRQTRTVAEQAETQAYQRQYRRSDHGKAVRARARSFDASRGCDQRPLSARQTEVLRILAAFLDEHGRAPNQPELNALGVKGAYEHLCTLRRKGFVTWEKHRPGTLRLLRRTPCL